MLYHRLASRNSEDFVSQCSCVSVSRGWGAKTMFSWSVWYPIPGIRLPLFSSRHSPSTLSLKLVHIFLFSLGVLTVWQLCHRGSNGFCTACTCTAAPFLRATLVAVCLVGAGLAGCFLAYIIAPTGRFNRVVSPFVPGTFDGFKSCETCLRHCTPSQLGIH